MTKNIAQKNLVYMELLKEQADKYSPELTGYLWQTAKRKKAKKTKDNQH